MTPMIEAADSETERPGHGSPWRSDQPTPESPPFFAWRPFRSAARSADRSPGDWSDAGVASYRSGEDASAAAV
jgi:hypothetical protein